MTKIQEKLLVLMDEFNQICQEHNIEYFFAGGTALGAIRNGGFLPWDDDADILIKRSEFERLDKIMNSMEFKNRAWVTESNNRTYLNPTARLFDLDSTDILESRLDYGAPKGCQLEVFIMDPFPSTEEEQKDFIKHLWLYSEVSNNYLLFGSLRMPAEMLDPDLFYYYKKRLETESVEDIKKEILSKITYPEEECDYLCGRWSCMPYVFKKEWMSAPRYCDFEGKSFPVPNGVLYEMVENYDANWDIIPPPSKQKVHPSIKSASKSYREIESNIREWCDEVGYNNLLHDNKADRVERLFARFKIEQEFAAIRRVYLEAVADKLNSRKWQFSYDDLALYEREFEEFFLTQFKYSYSKYKLQIHLNDDLLETMIMTLLYNDRVEDASLLVEINPKARIYERYKNLCYALGELKIKKYEEDEKSVRQLINTVKDIYGFDAQQELERASAWLESLTSERSEEEIDSYFEGFRHKNDLELIKYIGDMYKKAGADEKAQTFYNRVIKGSRNGMILYDLKKRGIEATSENSVKLPKEEPVDKRADLPKYRSRTECTAQLLNEFDAVCSAQGIPYIVGGVAARAVFENKKLVFPCLDVYVDKKDLRTIKKNLSHAGSERSVEVSKKNGCKSIYYTDRTTSLIDSYDMDSYGNKGMHLHIMSRENAGFDIGFLKDAKKYEWNGYEIRLPEDIEAWYEFLFVKKGEKEFPSYPNARCIVSSTIGYELIEKGIPKWKKLCVSMQESKRIVDETTARIDERSIVIDSVMDKVRKLYN